MIIDFHTHIYPPAVAMRAIQGAAGLLNAATDGTAQGLINSMENYNIDLSVALTLVNNPTKSESINSWAATVKNDKIIPLGSFHPKEPAPLETIDAIAKMGFSGVKVHPEYQDFRFSDPSLYPCWERCIAHDLFVITHAGSDIMYSEPFRSNPKELAEFHRQFPKLKLILAHMGSMDMWDEVAEHLVGLDLYLDLAMIGSFNFTPEKLAALIRLHGADRVLFGTDSPWLDQGESVEFIKSLPLSNEELDNIFYKNALKLLMPYSNLTFC